MTGLAYIFLVFQYVALDAQAEASAASHANVCDCQRGCRCPVDIYMRVVVLQRDLTNKMILAAARSKESHSYVYHFIRHV